MTLLAIDTSTEWASVAVADETGALLAEQTWRARRHDEALFASIERLLALGGRDLASVRQVAVAIGPGSFTGVRLAIAAAQGIARGSGARLLGVPTLDVVARPLRGLGLRVCALIPAGRGQTFAALYRERPRPAGAQTEAFAEVEHRGPREGFARPRVEWGRSGDIMVCSMSDLARRIAADTLFAGELDEAAAAELRAHLGPRAVFADRSLAPRRAAALAEIAAARFAAGERGDASLEPLYVKAPFIGRRTP